MNKEINIPFDELTTGLVIFCYCTYGFYVTLKRRSDVLLIHSECNGYHCLDEDNYKIILKHLNVKEIREYGIPFVNLINSDVEDLNNKHSYIKILSRIPESELIKFKSFSKSDLESGMLVEFEDGDLGVVIGDFIATKTQKLDLKSVKENLTSVYTNCTINKVFKPIHDLPLNLILNKDNYQVIFDREKVKDQIPPKYLVIKD